MDEHFVSEEEVTNRGASVEEVEGAEAPLKTGTWVDFGDGTDYPIGADTSYHSGDFEDAPVEEEKPKEKLTGEDRIDALCAFLENHGIFVPWEIAPKEEEKAEEPKEE